MAPPSVAVCGSSRAEPAGRARQDAVYAAEREALTGLGRRFRGPADAQRYLDALVDDEWWARRWPQVDRVIAGRSRSTRLAGYAVPGTAEVRLATWTEPVLLHEAAHVVTSGDGHGGAFTEALTALVRHRMGFFAYAALVGELRRSGICPSEVLAISGG